MDQMTIPFPQRARTARRLGDEGAERARSKAEEACPDFSEKAAAFIRNHATGMAPGATVRGEDLVNLMKQAGIRPGEDRAFGAIFAKAIREHVIVPVGFAARTKGHGTSGGRVYAAGECAGA